MSRAYVVGATLFTVGASTINEYSADSFLMGFSLKKVTSGVTLFLTPGLSVSVGYPIGDGEIVSVNGPATFYLAAQASDVVVGVAHAFSAGATHLPTLPPSAPTGLL